MSRKSRDARAGWLMRQDGGSFQRTYAVLKGRELSLYVSDARDETALATYELEDATISVPDASRVAKRFAFEVRPRAHAGAASGSPSALLVASAESKDEQEAWLQHLSSAAVTDAWPGGVDFLKRVQPLLYSMWVVRHTPSGAAASAAAQTAAAKSAGVPAPLPSPPKVPSPFPRLPALKAAPAWQRKALLLQKLRLTSVIFDGTDPSRYPEDRETKRNTLLEIVDYADSAGRAVFADWRVLEDTFTMIRLNLFRSLPVAPEPSGDPDVEEETFQDAQWPHLNIVYELLLRLVSMDQIDLALKKRAIDPVFVRQLLTLFDSEDARERDYLKTITHRIYSKLTQRRALIRRVIANVFYEFVYETEKHNGIAEMLEILASIINGFAVPIKDEHKLMLVKALLPLHSTRTVNAFHPQLSYCMALYVAKDHTLTRDIMPGLLKFWPFGNSQKQIMFLNELEDIFEYVQEDDLEIIRGPLAFRLGKCIGGLHFQVAERTLLLWNSERFVSLMLEHAGNRAAVLPVLFEPLFGNQESHWHESIRTLSSHILEQYAEIDPSLVAACRAAYEANVSARQQAEYEAAVAAADAAAAAEAAEAAAAAAVTVAAIAADSSAGSDHARPIRGGRRSSADAAAAPGGLSPSASSSNGRGSLEPSAADAASVSAGSSSSSSSSGLDAAAAAGTVMPSFGTPSRGAAAAASPGGVIGLGGTLSATVGPAGATAGAAAAAAIGGAGAAPGNLFHHRPTGVSVLGPGHGHALPLTPSSSAGGPAGGAALMLSPSAGVHKAPAVRGSTTFAVMSDILPGGHTLDSIHSRGAKRVFTLPLAGGEGAETAEGGE